MKRTSQRFSRFLTARWVCVFLVLLSVFLGLMSRQWISRNVLNSPSYDALVYQNQSYDDLHLLEQEGLKGYLKKYRSGAWHVPPLYVTLGTFSYMVFGLDPTNAYLVNVLFFFVFAWSTYLLFRYAKLSHYLALLSTLLVSLSPGILSYSMRHFTNDFAAASMFLFATAILLYTRQLRKRGLVIFYGIILGCSLLIKSSLLPYYIPHVLILFRWLFAKGFQWPRFWNLSYLVPVLLVVSGWFYFPNMVTILDYYWGWTGTKSEVTKAAAGITDTLDSSLFYFRNVARFHYEGLGARWIWGILGLVGILGFIRRIRHGKTLVSHRATIFFVLLVGQYGVLSIYPSKVNVVDYSVLPLYFLVPIGYLFSLKMKFGRLDWEKIGGTALLILLLFLSLNNSSGYLLRPSVFPANQDWKVKETLSNILTDAKKQGHSEVVVGSTMVHPYYTCENMRFYSLSGAFPSWRNKFKIPGIDSAKSPEELFSYVKNSDYVVTLDGWQGPSHIPNNQHAQQVNSWLKQGRGGYVLFYQDSIPKDSTVKVYRRSERLSYEPLQFDGWALAGHRLNLRSQQAVVTIQIEGQISLPKSFSYPVQLFLLDDSKQIVSEAFVVENSSPFVAQFPIKMRSEWQGQARLQLSGNYEYSPAKLGVSNDNRQLLAMITRIQLKSEWE